MSFENPAIETPILIVIEPQIAVVDGHYVGKSSVLESFVGR